METCTFNALLRWAIARPHIIPLTDQASSLLETLKRYGGNREYVLPSDNFRTHANSQTANMALKRMGFQDRLVSHGMRSMASTILNEHGWDPELIEVALATSIRIKVGVPTTGLPTSNAGAR